MFKTRKNLKIAMENNKVLYEQLEEKRKLDIERQKEIVKLRNEIEALKHNIREYVEINKGLGLICEKLGFEKDDLKKECANLKRLCTKNNVDYKKKGDKK